MAISELNHYNIRAAAPLLLELRDFYCAALGLSVGHRPSFNSVGYWLYAGTRPLLHLSTAKENEQRLPHVTGTFDHVAFTCSDFEEMRANLERMQVPYTVTPVPGTGHKQIFLEDPAGNGIELNFQEAS